MISQNQPRIFIHSHVVSAHWMHQTCIEKIAGGVQVKQSALHV